VFDWINSFSFSKLIQSIDNNMDIFKDMIKSPISVDSYSKTALYNHVYAFRLPHEKSIDESSIVYNRRFSRFKNYKNIVGHFLFIRLINTGLYEVEPESIVDNYNKSCYDKLLKHLPHNSKVLLCTNKKLSVETKNKIYHEFILVDDIIKPSSIAYGDFSKFDKEIIEMYENCFQYIEHNFDNLDVEVIKDFISNDNLHKIEQLHLK